MDECALYGCGEGLSWTREDLDEFRDALEERLASEDIYKYSARKPTLSLDRGMNGRTFNADVNGALNIIRKSSVVDMNILYGRGEVDTPVRIRIA